MSDEEKLPEWLEKMSDELGFDKERVLKWYQHTQSRCEICKDGVATGGLGNKNNVVAMSVSGFKCHLHHQSTMEKRKVNEK